MSGKEMYFFDKGGFATGSVDQHGCGKVGGGYLGSSPEDSTAAFQLRYGRGIAGWNHRTSVAVGKGVLKPLRAS